MMTIQPVLVAIPAPCSTGATDTAGGLPTEPQASACAKFQRSGVSRGLKPTARLRTPERVIQQQEYSRVALRECARLCGAPLAGWEKGPDEAPLPNQGYYWSVSHKREWAAAVVAKSPVGIDIEHITPRREAVYAALASESEWTLLDGRSWHSFFRLWTAKEATLKANRVGIAGFSDCQLLEVPDECHMALQYKQRVWSIEHYYHADHIASVTCGCWAAAGGAPPSVNGTSSPSRDREGAVSARDISPVSWCLLSP